MAENDNGGVPELRFDRSFSAPPQELVAVTANVRRMVANNPGPMTFTGTCTYVVGQGEVAIIDPGPDLADHRNALLQALRNETVRFILVTHSHDDHCASATAMKQATGAQIIGCAPAPELIAIAGEDGVIDSAHDLSYAPDAVLTDGETLTLRGLTLEAVATPGHTGNHLSFALVEEASLFTGDHVMAWSTSVVIPPDGAMADYRRSLEKLLFRDDTLYWPGHGGPVRDPKANVAALIQHRREREAAILAALKSGSVTVKEIVARVYGPLSPPIEKAAQKSALAHLLDLAERGLIRVGATGPPDHSDATIWRLI
ncbi:MAG: MBL fold metallo-hydrolase [Methylovirgula sp.]|jgi:glyoxylase-like metal-dependent hydrolase (beta-lactamase superfamily II)